MRKRRVKKKAKNGQNNFTKIFLADLKILNVKLTRDEINMTVLSSIIETYRARLQKFFSSNASVSVFYSRYLCVASNTQNSKPTKLRLKRLPVVDTDV